MTIVEPIQVGANSILGFLWKFFSKQGLEDIPKDIFLDEHFEKPKTKHHQQYQWIFIVLNGKQGFEMAIKECKEICLHSFVIIDAKNVTVSTDSNVHNDKEDNVPLLHTSFV